jgi:hypothetical protein
MAKETYGETLSGWQDLVAPLTANAGELPHLETHRAQLVELLKQAQDLIAQQAALTAGKQEISKRLEAVIDTGRKLATYLRVGVRQHYGNRAEKLVEFKLQPLRSRRRRPANGGPTPPETPAPEPAPAPTPATPSPTDPVR